MFRRNRPRVEPHILDRIVERVARSLSVASVAVHRMFETLFGQPSLVSRPRAECQDAKTSGSSTATELPSWHTRLQARQPQPDRRQRVFHMHELERGSPHLEPARCQPANTVCRELQHCVRARGPDQLPGYGRQQCPLSRPGWERTASVP
eukprot:8221295-Lingulodinium_polyedra.AAC.3